MRLVLLTCAATWLAAGCNPSAEQRAELAELAKQKADVSAAKADLEKDVASLSATKEGLQKDIGQLAFDDKVLRAEAAGKGLHYILRCSIRQIHYSISIKKQIADAVNEDSFDLMTDKESYERAAVGSDLFNSFRLGSAVLKGSLGSWRIKVEDKRVEVDP